MAPNQATTLVAALRRERELDAPRKATPTRGTGPPSCPRPSDDSPTGRWPRQRAAAPRGPHQDGRARTHRAPPHAGCSARPPGAPRAVSLRLGHEPRQRDHATPRPRHSIAGPPRPTAGAPQPSYPTFIAPRSSRRPGTALQRPRARSRHRDRAGPARFRSSRHRTAIPTPPVSSRPLSLRGPIERQIRPTPRAFAIASTRERAPRLRSNPLTWLRTVSLEMPICCAICAVE